MEIHGKVAGSSDQPSSTYNRVFENDGIHHSSSNTDCGRFDKNLCMLANCRRETCDAEMKGYHSDGVQMDIESRLNFLIENENSQLS